MLEVKDLHVSIEDREILHGINLSIPDGEVHALFGPNGSGKSVLIMSILGYPEYSVTQGEIYLDGQDILGLDINERVNLGLAVSEQRPPTIKGVKLKDLFELLIPDDAEGRAYAEEMVDKFNLERFLERDINDGLSGGEIKQSELSLVLITRPKFLILDEPDSGVDPIQLKKVGNMINETLREKHYDLPKGNLKRNAGLIVTHSASVLDYVHTDRAHLLINGRIHCNGNPRIMMNQIRSHGYEYCIKCQLESVKNNEQ
jgi:Fe-S cluster assembly ATP-binding protein